MARTVGQRCITHSFNYEDESKGNQCTRLAALQIRMFFVVTCTKAQGGVASLLWLDRISEAGIGSVIRGTMGSHETNKPEQSTSAPMSHTGPTQMLVFGKSPSRLRATNRALMG